MPMGTLNAIYVRAPDERTAAALKAIWPTAYTEPETQFYAIDQPDDRFDCPEAELRELSARLGTDVLWLTFQSVVGAFEFYHWHGGPPLPSLAYGCFVHERAWERVEGTPEPWERRAMFDPKYLAYALEYTDDPAERRELERIYREGEIATGRLDPNIEAREC